MYILLKNMLAESPKRQREEIVLLLRTNQNVSYHVKTIGHHII